MKAMVKWPNNAGACWEAAAITLAMGDLRPSLNKHGVPQVLVIHWHSCTQQLVVLRVCMHRTSGSNLTTLLQPWALRANQACAPMQAWLPTGSTVTHQTTEQLKSKSWAERHFSHHTCCPGLRATMFHWCAPDWHWFEATGTHCQPKLGTWSMLGAWQTIGLNTHVIATE